MATRAMGLDRGAIRANPGGLAGAEAQGGEGARHRRPSSRCAGTRRLARGRAVVLARRHTSRPPRRALRGATLNRGSSAREGNHGQGRASRGAWVG
jgi:hypothetical protein